MLFCFYLLKVGNLFGSHRSTIINLYNGAFDSSSALFLIIKVTDIQNQSIACVFKSSRMKNIPDITQLSFLCSWCMSLASPFIPPSYFCLPAASFTSSGPSSCCPETSFLTRFLINTHTGENRLTRSSIFCFSFFTIIQDFPKRGSGPHQIGSD